MESSFMVSKKHEDNWALLVAALNSVGEAWVNQRCKEEGH